MFVKRLFSATPLAGDKLPTDKTLRVMQWNILCNALAFGSFDRVPDEVLQWEYREPLIVHHIKEVDADVVCLEEVDMFQSIMAALGQIYDGECIMKADGMMGCAILWRKDRVTKVGEVQSGNYLDQDGKIQNQIYVHA